MANWVKLQTGIFDNRKVKRLTNIEQLIFIKLIVLAGKINDDGAIYITPTIPYSIEELHGELCLGGGVGVVQVSTCIKKLKEMNMIFFNDLNIMYLSGWAEHQNQESLEKSREKTKERVQRFREKHKNSNVTNDDCNVTRNVTVTLRNGIDIDKEKEEDIDNIYTPISPANCNVTHCSKDVFMYSSSFEDFWEHYPKKKGKGDAFKSWKKLNPNNDLTQQIINSVESLKRTRDWIKDRGKYIPMASTFINQRRWEDDPNSYNMTTFTTVEDMDKAMLMSLAEEGGAGIELHSSGLIEGR